MTKKNGEVFFTFLNARLTSTISISLVLFLLGSIALLGLFANKLSHYLKENLSFSIVLNENMKEAQILSMQKRLEATPYVKSTVYISKEQAAKELEAELGESLENFLGYNPLFPSIEIHLNAEYANNDSISIIEKNIRQDSNINDILYRKDLFKLVNDNIKRAGIILLFLAAVLMVISFALISNTIRLTIYSKRFLIHTMRLVGATNGFIRKPFIKSNILAGVVAAVIAICMLSGILYYLSFEITDMLELINIDMLLIVFAIVIALGIIISTTATFFAVNRYLRMKSDNMYYI